PLLSSLREADPAADGRPGQYEPGREHHPGRELGRVVAGRLRRRGQALTAAYGECEGHPDDPWRAFRQVPDRLLRRPDRRRVQGVGGAIRLTHPCIGRTCAMPIFEITHEAIRRIPETSFSAAGIKERGDLQRLLRHQIDVVSPETLVIAEEFGEWED